jgi:hypothetical protein
VEPRRKTAAACRPRDRDFANQTITVLTHAPANATYKDSFTVAATSSSGLPVAFSSGGACSNSGATFTMTSATGTCSVEYDQAGNGNYNAAPQVTESVSAHKANQSITFGALADKTYGDADFSVSATASSGLSVSLAGSGSCTVSGATVHLTGAGSCTVAASQAGDSNYAAAPAVSRTFAIAQATALKPSSTCLVPKVIGKRLGSAKLTIKQRHCRTGKVGYAYSRKNKKGIVISQSRRPGLKLPPNSKINLVVSLGRRG